MLLVLQFSGDGVDALVSRLFRERRRPLLRIHVVIVVFTMFRLVFDGFQDGRIFFVAICGVQLFAC
jgi:hypothetical protein